jgi:undecaprenyl-diphosphatase
VTEHLHLPGSVDPEGPIDLDSRSRLASAVDELVPASVHHPSGIARAVDRFDHRVDGWFEQLRGERWADELFEAASRLGDWSLIWMLLNAAQGLIGPTGPERAVRNTAVLFVESVSVNQGIKRLFNRVRPEADPDVAGRIRKPTTSSFPSGHASAAFTAAGLLTAGHPARKPAVYALAVIVSTSRIHTRMHHASDVAAGALVGIGIASAARRWWPAP